jgi:hypothetical protein
MTGMRVRSVSMGQANVNVPDAVGMAVAEGPVPTWGILLKPARVRLQAVDEHDLMRQPCRQRRRASDTSHSVAAF